MDIERDEILIQRLLLIFITNIYKLSIVKY